MVSPVRSSTVAQRTCLAWVRGRGGRSHRGSIADVSPWEDLGNIPAGMPTVGLGLWALWCQISNGPPIMRLMT